MRKLLAFALTAMLCACSLASGPAKDIANLTADDVTTAAALAKAGGDTVGEKCWGAQLPVAQAVQAGKTIGVAASVELARVFQLQMQGPCAPIMMPIMMKLAPALGALQLFSGGLPLPVVQ